MIFDWDSENQGHAIRHRLTPTIVASVSEIDPQFFLDDEAMSGSHIMIGPDRTGALWTVILLDLGEDLWRPITGWPSDREEVAMYREAKISSND